MSFHYILTSLCASLTLLGSVTAHAQDSLVVVTDIAPIHSLAAQVMAGVAEPVLLVGPNDSPHNFALRPSQAEALQNADTVFWVGPDLTPWLEEPLAELAADSPRSALMDAPGAHHLSPRDGPIFGESDDHDHEHDDDHGHGETDPHGWLDPDNAALWLDIMADSLSALAPEHAQTFRSNADTAKQELTQTVTEISATLAPARDAEYVVFHDAFQYFEDHFGLTSLGAVALSDAAAPSPKRLAELRANLQEAKPACAFSEPQVNTQFLDTALEGTGVKIAVLDPLGSSYAPSPGLYSALLQDMTNSIATCAD